MAYPLLSRSQISLIFFYNDNLFFFSRLTRRNLKLHNILEDYQKASRQLINYEKFVMVLNTKVKDCTKDKIRNWMSTRHDSNIGN